MVDALKQRNPGLPVSSLSNAVNITLGDGATNIRAEKYFNGLINFISSPSISQVKIPLLVVQKKLPFDLVLGTNGLQAMGLTWNFGRNEVNPTTTTTIEPHPAPLVEKLSDEEAVPEELLVDFVELKGMLRHQEVQCAMLLCAAEVDDGLLRQPIPSVVAAQPLMEEFSDVLVASDVPVQVSQKLVEKGIAMDIELTDETPVRRSPYRMSPKELEELRVQLGKLLQEGVIHPSSSPFASPVLFVKKKNGERRLCVDYRALNLQTKPLAYALPQIADNLDRLGGAAVFSVIDLKSGYHQMPLAEGSQEKTAFTTRYGLYEYRAVPFGLRNAPAHFQRLIDRVVGDLQDVCAVTYIDDILIYSSNHEDHKEHLKLVLQRLREFGLKANVRKCHFFKEEVEYCGHLVSKAGIRTDPAKVSAVSEWPAPTTVVQIQSFLGFCNFYRRFIPDFAKVSAPIVRLTRKEVPFTWGPEQDVAFQELKRLMTTAPVLAPPDVTKEFHIYPDACNEAMGAVLTQLHDGKHRPVAYLSRKFTPPEKNYTVTERETLAIIECLRKWRCYVEGVKKVVHTDHKPLIYLRKLATPNQRQSRWIEELEVADPEIVYHPGKTHMGDAPSRRPGLPDQEVGISDEDPHGIVSAEIRCHVLVGEEVVDMRELDFEKDWPLYMVDYIRIRDLPPHLTEPQRQKIERESSHFLLIHNTLKHKVIVDGQEERVPYVPSTQREEVIRRYHEGTGHFGGKGTYELIRPNFWWPSMREDIAEFVKHCTHCQLMERQVAAPLAPLHPLQPAVLPFERWGIDFIQDLPESEGTGCKNIITAIDYTTRWVVAKAVKNRDTETVAQFLYEEILLNYGAPREIITDRASVFSAQVLQEYMRLQRIHHKASTPYHPRTNGMVERMHGVMVPLLSKMCEGVPRHWDRYLPAAVFALRARVHEVTGYSAFKLVYGIQPRLPMDPKPWRVLSWDNPDDRELFEIRMLEGTENVGCMRRAAILRSQRQQRRMKQRYDANPRVQVHKYQRGEFVKRKHHSHTKFEFLWTGPYVIKEVGPNDTYELMWMNGEPLPYYINHDHLAKFTGDTSQMYNGREQLTRMRDAVAEQDAEEPPGGRVQPHVIPRLVVPPRPPPDIMPEGQDAERGAELDDSLRLVRLNLLCGGEECHGS